MTEPAWRPSVILKAIAVVEGGSGVVLAGSLLWSIAHRATIGWPFQVMFEGIVAASVLAGVALYKGEPPGFFASCLLQALQIVRVVTHSFSFSMMLGPGVFFGVPSGGSPQLFWDAGATVDLLINRSPHGHLGFAVNLVAVVVLLILLRAKAQSGQSWLPPRHRVVWDKGQWIGAYQIAAGALGVMNAVAHDRVTINLVFSLAVIGSGVALLRRKRLSDRIAVAINAVQVPAIHIGNWMYLVRSGLSFVTALTWGPSGGIQFQFDVGSLINDPLAAGVDGFVGINVTALALTLWLSHYRPNAPAPTRTERKLFLTQR